MTNNNISGFDMEAAIKALREGQELTGKSGILIRLLNNSPKPSCKVS